MLIIQTYLTNDLKLPILKKKKKIILNNISCVYSE